MKRKQIDFGMAVFVIFTGLASVSSAASCNRESAQKVQGMIQEMAKITRESAIIRVQWGNDFRSWDKDTQLKMAEAYANSDACLSASAREIRFYSPAGKFNAVASPTAGIRLID